MIPSQQLPTDVDSKSFVWAKLLTNAISGVVGGFELLRLYTTQAVGGIAQAVQYLAPMADGTIYVYTAGISAGAVVTIPQATELTVIAGSAATVSAGIIITLPPSPIEGQKAKIYSKFGLASATLSAGSIAILNAPTTIGTGASLTLTYTAKWSAGAWMVGT